MMAWRLARSLAQLRNEINAIAPDRRRLSDGTIGNPDHASRASRHNPNSDGVVTALDITDDPAGGCPIHVIARRLVKTPHPNLEYVISNGQIAKRKTRFRWEPYRTGDPHKRHAHFAVGIGPDSAPRPPYDNTTPWGVAPIAPPPQQQEDDDMAVILRVGAGTPSGADDEYWVTDWVQKRGVGDLDEVARLQAAGLRMVDVVKSDADHIPVAK